MSKKKNSFKPWLSRPTVNRSVTLPFTRPLTQRMSNLNEFHPNELDPYLLFDAQSSMRGTLEAPTLDLDPSKPDTLNVITAVRAGVASFTDASGLIQEAAANTVRVDQTQGAELTPNIYQRVPYSTPDSNWTTTSITLVEDFGVAPDDTQSASKVTKPALGGSANDRVKYPTISIANGTTYSVSVHLKNIDVAGFTTIAARVSGGSLFRCKFIWSTSSVFNDNGTTSNRLVEDLGDGWYRVSFSFDANGSALSFEIDIDRSTEGHEDTSSVLVWGAQLEEGTTASSFVANTTGSPKFITGATYGPRVPMMLVEPSATNLVTHSEDFSNTAWSKTSFGTGVVPVVTANNAISPDGTQSASRVVFGTGGGTTSSEESFVTDTISTTIGVSYTESVYLKGDVGGEQILMRGAGGSGYTTLTLTTEWVRYEATEVETYDTTTYFQIGLRQGLGGVVINSDITVYAWGAQVETGSVATSYIPTSGSTVTRAKDDLEIRDRTNLVTYSEDFSQWTPENATTATTLLSGPISGQNASKFIPTATIERQGLTIVQTGTGDMVISVFAKKGEYDVLQITDAVNGASFVNFDLTSGTVGSSNTMVGEIQSFGNGWYRCISKFNSSSSIIRIRLSVAESSTDGRLLHFAGNGTDGLYLWGAQRETGSVATSYIPTSGAAASRNTFSDFFNSGGDGTFYAEFVPRELLSEQWYLLAGQDNDRRFMYSNANNPGLNAYDGTSSKGYGNMVANQLNRAAFTYTSTTHEASLDGSTTTSSVSNGNYSTTSRLYLASPSNDKQMNGHLKRLIYWPTSSDRL
jgi:hypothetical protein